MTANSRFTHRHKGSAGFTLIEMLVVVGIIGLLAAVGFPPLLNYLKLYRIRGAQQQVMGEIQFARNKAISKNVNFGVVLVALSPTTYRYVIEDDLTVPRDPMPVKVSARIAQAKQTGPLRVLPQGVRFGVKNECTGFEPNAAAMRFNRLGTWCNPGVGSCAPVDVGVDAFQNEPAGTLICLYQPETTLNVRVRVSNGGRVRAEG